MADTFNNRVFGCAIIKALNSNYNADFSHHPRTLPDGSFYATDKALKYTVRNYINDFYPDEKVFFFKSMDNSLKPRSLDERYTYLFGDFKTLVTSDKYSVFLFDGEKVDGILPQKPKAKAVNTVFKELEEDDPLKPLEKHFKAITKSNTQLIEPQEVKIDTNEVEPFFFYLDGEKKVKKIEAEEDIIKQAVSAVLEEMGGGVNRNETLKDLLTCIDTRVFGATFAGKTNISIHGTTQITHGKDCYKKGDKFTSAISSPFRNPKEKSQDSTMTTLGSQTDLQEGHYVHHLSVNPKNIKEEAKRVNSQGLTKKDIEKLKEGLRKGATYLDSSRKIGVENELLLWVQLREGSKAVLPSFVELITVNENKEIDLNKIRKLLAKEHIKPEIEKIELYYNKGITTIINGPDGAEELDL